MASRKDPDYLPEIVEDIRNGMDKEALMKKYYLNEKGLEREIARLRRFVDLEGREAVTDTQSSEAPHPEEDEVIFDFPDEKESDATTESAPRRAKKWRGKKSSELEETVGRAMELKDYYGEEVDPITPKHSNRIISWMLVFVVIGAAAALPVILWMGASDISKGIKSFFHEYVPAVGTPNQPTPTFHRKFRHKERPVPRETAHAKKEVGRQGDSASEDGGGGAIQSTPGGRANQNNVPIEDGGGGKL